MAHAHAAGAYQTAELCCAAVGISCSGARPPPPAGSLVKRPPPASSIRWPPPLRRPPPTKLLALSPPPAKRPPPAAKPSSLARCGRAWCSRASGSHAYLHASMPVAGRCKVESATPSALNTWPCSLIDVDQANRKGKACQSYRHCVPCLTTCRPPPPARPPPGPAAPPRYGCLGCGQEPWGCLSLTFVTNT
jgi:hypothetical protein